MLDDLSKLIEFKSVMGDATTTLTGQAPFGEEVLSALNFCLRRGQEFGLSARNVDGYYGTLDYENHINCTISHKMIGILCHLDVVPAGQGWSTDPYKLTIIDGVLYGRGVVDNKGSAIACIYALRRLQENHVQLHHTVRLILGCNEENGSKCIEHYALHDQLPVVSFVPDADFPIINSEKGILHCRLTLPIGSDDEDYGVISITGGTRPNVVPSECEVTIAKDSILYDKIASLTANRFDYSLLNCPEIKAALLTRLIDLDKLSVHLNGSHNIVIAAKGISAHAMCPQEGDNAIWKILVLLHALLPQSSTLASAADCIASSTALELLGINTEDETGKLTMNCGLIEKSTASCTSGKILGESDSYDSDSCSGNDNGSCNSGNNNIVLTLDLRLPRSITKDSVIAALGKVFGGESVEVEHFQPNLFIDPTSKLITTLLKVYTDCTGLEGKPVQTGGGTYARKLPCAVAYGSVFPDTISNIHNIDECVSVENFYKLTEIYYNAILALDAAFRND